jgi:two-component system nitrogen regulation sensor histidine kinase NtrY
MTLRLQTRLILAFLLLAALLVGLTSGLLYREIHSRFRHGFESQVAAAKETVHRHFRKEAAVIRRQLEGVLADSDFVREIDDGKFDELGPAQQRRLRDRALALMKTANFSAFWIMKATPNQPILIAGHRAGSPSKPPGLKRFIEGAQLRHTTIYEPLQRGGRPVELPVLVSKVELPGRSLILAAGRAFDGALARDLRIQGVPVVEVTLRSRTGEVLATTLPKGSDLVKPAGFETETVVHTAPGESKAALHIALHVSKGPLDRQIAGLVRTTLVVAGGAVLLALILGPLIARRMTRPIRSLAEATTRIAEGEREISIKRGRIAEIGELTDAFEKMARDLGQSEQRLRSAERVAAWEEIARELAHEIKNPLTPIQMSIETMRRTWAREHPDFAQVFEESTITILEEVERLKKIVESFREFAHMPRIDPQPTDLNGVISQCVTLYRGGTAEVQFTESLEPTIGLVCVDAEQLIQVMQNLLNNAVEATVSNSGERVVRVASRRRKNGEVEVTVEDNGPGIDEAELHRIFTPYFTKKADGTGLGLPVVHRIVSAHDGRVGVSSNKDSGSRFIIRLPASRSVNSTET